MNGVEPLCFCCVIDKQWLVGGRKYIKHSIAPLMKVQQTETPLSINIKHAEKIGDFRIET